MAKGKKRAKQQAKAEARRARRHSTTGQSRYARKHKGGGNTGPNGMWIKVA